MIQTKSRISRKLSITIIVFIILCGVFLLMVFKQEITDGIFIAWLGALLGNAGIYTEGNIRAKQYKQEGK
ncbi:hypothetical protein LCGC14_0521530 [marine sediment metagenome]|uniref:Uncharacterized protein n=1 Tax=marine sediment metagenome TaxID=412755 RepID=A0A0F9V6K3_9ZZZZ